MSRSKPATEKLTRLGIQRAADHRPGMDIQPHPCTLIHSWNLPISDVALPVRQV
jgi:hypothetical protein